jgi:hypothetical protein
MRVFCVLKLRSTIHFSRRFGENCWCLENVGSISLRIFRTQRDNREDHNLCSSDRASWQVSYKNQQDASNIQNLFCHKTLHISGIFCVHHQELPAVRTAIDTFHAGAYQLPCVQQITPDDGHRRCPKHVEFYDKINFGYLMHLVGCFVRNLSRCTVTWT